MLAMPIPHCPAGSNLLAPEDSRAWLEQPSPIPPCRVAKPTKQPPGVTVAEKKRRAATRWRWILAVGLLANLGALGLGLGTLSEHYGQKWTGLPIFKTNTVGPRILASPESYPHLRRIVPGTWIAAVDGRTIEEPPDMDAILDEFPEGTPVTHEFITNSGQSVLLDLPTNRLGLDHIIGLFLSPMVAGLLFLLAGTIPAFAQPAHPSARIVALMAIGLTGNFIFLIPDYFLGHRFTPFSFIFPFIGVPALFQLGLCFPKPMWPLTRWPRALPATLYAGSALFWIAFAYVFENHPRSLLPLELVEVGFLATSLLVLVSNLIREARRSEATRLRAAARVVLPSIALFVLVSLILAAATWGVTDFYVPPAFVLLPIPVLAVSMAYAILGYHLFGLERDKLRLIARSALLIGAISLFLLSTTFLEFFVRPTVAWSIAGSLTLLTTSALPILTSFYSRIDRWIEKVIFPQQQRARESLRTIAGEVGRLRDSESLIDFLRRQVAPLLGNAPLSLVRGRSDGPLEEASPRPGELRIELSADDMLTKALADPKLIEAGIPRESAARNRLAEIRAELVIPLTRHDDLIGGIFVGRRRDNGEHEAEDIQLLYDLAGPTGIALENALRMDQINELTERLEGENLYLRAEVEEEFADSEIIGRSQGIREALSQLKRVASANISVLIVGETGTGKELAVRTLHAASERSDRPLIKVACAALPENLLESELFGHERGAFTGAERAREGRFEIADGGTLFFDDVDTLNPNVQAKLLRALQEGEIQRLGSNRVRKVDVRVVAATNRDLQEEVAAGRFREDLYYRLAVVPIRLPPLRERLDDLELLVEHLARTQGRRLGREIAEVSAETLLEMRRHSWPGNIRELRNVVERAIVLESGPILRLPGPLTAGSSSPATDGPITSAALARAKIGSEPLAELVLEFKKAMIAEALQRNEGNQRKAAEVLGMHRPSLTRMIRDLGLRRS